MATELRTMIGDSTFGSIWQEMMRDGRIPSTSLASTKVERFTDHVSAVTGRANYGQ
jgi:hypothetical protein